MAKFFPMTLPFIMLGVISAGMLSASELFPFETKYGIDLSGAAAEKNGWKAQILFHPERIGIMDGETIKFGVAITPPEHIKPPEKLRIKWAIIGREREISLGDVKIISITSGKAFDTNMASLKCLGFGSFWLQCLIMLPDGNSITLRRPFIILDEEPQTTFTIYACAAPSLSDKPWRHGADTVAEAGINLMLFNAIDDWNGEAGKRAEERLDWFACFGIKWVDFPSTIDWTLIHAPIATGMWDAYHDPDVRAFCRQLTQCTAQWGRKLPSFFGISLMDEPAARSFWGNNADVFRERFLTYDPIADPLRFYADYHRFNCWSMGDLFRDCREAARKVSKTLKICVEGHNNFWTGSGIYAPLNIPHLDLNTTHHYYGDYGWGAFATLLGCEMAQVGLRDLPLWMMGGFGPLKREQYEAQVGQAIARGAKAFGYFELADPKRFSQMVGEIKPINADLQRVGTIFQNLRRMRGEVAVLFSISNAAFFAKHPPVRFDAWKDPQALVKALSEALKTLKGTTEMDVKHGVVIHEPDERTDYAGACIAAFMALNLSGYDADFIVEEELTPQGLSGKKVIVAPQIVYLPKASLDSLYQFVKSGGIVFTDAETRIRSEIWQKLPISIVSSLPKGAGFEERKEEQEAKFEEMRKILAESVARYVKPRIEGIPKGIIYGYFDGGMARYLVIVNASWRRNERGIRELAPFCGEILAKDLRRGLRIQIGKGIVGKGDETQKWELSLNEGKFTIYAFVPEGIERVQISAPKRVTQGQRQNFTVTLVGSKGKPLPIVAPLEVQIRVGNDKPLTYFRATDENGKFNGTFVVPLASAAKRVQIRVTELLTNKTSLVSADIEPSKALINSQELPTVVISDPDAICQFFAKFSEIKVISPPELHEYAAMLARKLTEVLHAHPRISVDTPEKSRKPEKFPPSVDPEFHRKRDPNAQVHPHFNPTHLEIGANAILIGDEKNNELIRDLLHANLLPNRMDNELYSTKALLQYAWSPFDPDKDVIILRARTKDALSAGVEAIAMLAKMAGKDATKWRKMGMLN